MPLTYSTDHARRRIRVTVTGPLRRAEIAQSVSDRVTIRGIGYDQVWDLRTAKWDVRTEELQSIAQDYRAALGSEPPGLLGIVTSDDLEFGTIRQHEALLRSFGREMTVFRSLEEADAWLDRERGALR